MISRGKLAQIHIARQQLGLSDEDYRAILARTAGVRSAKDLNDNGVSRVLNEFKRLGWQPKPSRRAGRKPNTFNKRAALHKIEAQLADMGLSWAYAEAIARRQTGIEKLEWLRSAQHFRGVIAALEVEQEKRDRLAAIDRWLAYTGESRDSLARRYQLPKGWERNRTLLGQLLEALSANSEQGGY